MVYYSCHNNKKTKWHKYGERNWRVFNKENLLKLKVYIELQLNNETQYDRNYVLSNPS